MKAFRVGRNVFLFLTASAALLLSAASAGKFGLDPDKGLALAFGALTKLSFLATAAWCALGCAKSIASLAWRAMAAAWICYACGQGCLVFYQLVLEIALPFPSWADLFFVTGSLCLVFALWAFLFELQSSGCPIGWKRRLPVAFGLIIGLGGFALWKMLWPVLSAETETSEKLLSLVYPLTDLLLLIPALLLFQATAPFRGGFIHRIWATMLAGISLFLIGDLLFALMVENPHPVLVWSVDMSYIAGYGLAALACLLQFAVTRSPLD